jgi:thiol:disulfide interchange protein DsbD
LFIGCFYVFILSPMKTIICIWLATLTWAAAQFVDPFHADVQWTPAAGGTGRLVLVWTVPAEHYLYADALGVRVEGAVVKPEQLAPRDRLHDAFSDGEREVLPHDFTDAYQVSGGSGAEQVLTIDYQGCNHQLCFLPKTRRFRLDPMGGAAEMTDGEIASTGKDLTPPGNPGTCPADFRVRGRVSGYLRAPQFMEFLARSSTSGDPEGDGEPFARRGIWVTLLLILVGGLALNLTPCVLPMIPINLAIIGAGLRGGDRRRGFLLGGFYGLGIAGAYGALGLAVLLTGARFGTLNALPGFNLGIAVIFIGLAAAMLGLFNLDLSRFQKAGPVASGGDRGWMAYGQALIMGVVSALLAGACVAPAVIAVLVLAASLYAQGWGLALLLPFLLGLGMASPWPFAGAGLAFLPKPGAWMENIKRAFAAVILAAGLYYGWQGIDQIRSRSASARAAVREAAEQSMSEGWLTSLPDAFERARAEGKPVLIDFWATWCKSCLAMEKTTFKDPAVRAALDRFIKVKIQAEQPSDPATRALMNEYAVLGLPTYVVLQGSPAR